MKKKLINSKLLLWMSVALLAAATMYVFTKNYLRLHRPRIKIYDSFMTQVHGIKLDKFGKPHDELVSPFIRHYQKQNRMLADKPFFIFYSDNAPPWHVNADHGEGLNGNKLVILTGHVKVRQLPGPNSQDVTLNTTKLYLYPDQSIAKTDQPVTIEQPSSIVHGVGMIANMKKGTVKILSKTEGMYGTP